MDDQRLQASKARATDLSPDPFVVLRAVRGPDGTVADFEWIYANDAAVSNFETTRTQIVGKRYLSRFPASSCFERYSAAVQTQTQVELERVIKLSGGSATTYRVLAVPTGDDLAVHWRDVTRFVETERREQLSAAMLDAVNAAVIATDLDFRVQYWNKSAEDLYGWSARDALGRNVVDLLRPEQEWSPAAQGPLTETRVGEITLHRRTGEAVDVLVQTTPLVEEGRRVGLVGVSFDVTALTELRRQAEAAREQFTVLGEAMAEGMFALDADGRVTYLNRAAGELLGWSPRDLMGEPMHVMIHFQHLDGTAFPAEECPLTEVRRTGETVRMAHDRFFRRDGSAFPVAYTGSPLWGTDGRPRGCVVVFRDISRDLDEEQRARQALENLGWVGRIQDALDEGHFLLYAQPIVSVHTGEVVRHELLLRMQRDGEIVLPGRFLPVAEEFGLVRQIDAWVFAEAARLAAAGHTVECNLSARSVVHPETVNVMRHALAEYSAPATRIVCEITETALIADTVAAERFVHDVCNLGLRVSLDDFGSGYAGLGYLKRLAVSELKIDAQFVTDAARDESSRHVITAVVSLARGFGLCTVAEGVEEAETLALLARLGVDFAQGYAIGRPAPVGTALGDVRTSGLRPTGGWRPDRE